MRHAAPLLALSITCLSFGAHADWKEALKTKAKDAAAQTAQEQLGLPLTAPADAKVYIISPKNGDTVTGPVKVLFGLSGMGVAPAGTAVENTGHHHLLIDEPTVDSTKPLPTSDNVIHFGKGQTETTVTLKPGKHTLQLLLADYKHQPFNPSVISEKVVITVK